MHLLDTLKYNLVEPIEKMLGALEKEVSPQKLTVSKRIPPTRPLSKGKIICLSYTQISFTVLNRKA